MSKIVSIGAGGLGDSLLSFSVAHNLTFCGHEVDSIAAVRPEIYKVLEYLYGDSINLSYLPEEYSRNHEIINSSEQKFSEKRAELLGKYDDLVYTVPDLLFRNRYALSLKKYRLSGHVIKSTRTLINKRVNDLKLIYLGLQTTTPGYFYKETPTLIRLLSEELPEYTIYFPNVMNWAGDGLYKLEGSFRSNVWIDDNPDFIESVKILQGAAYCVCTCNGPSHIAYHLGIPRLQLDPQYHKLPWVARWKEDLNESISIHVPPETAVQIVKNNLEYPETVLIPRGESIGENRDWVKELIFK